MQHVYSPGQPSQNQGRESQGEDRSVSQSWRKYSVSIGDLKLLVVLYKCHPPVITDHSVYFFPSITMREVDTPSCNRGCLRPVGRLVFLGVSDQAHTHSAALFLPEERAFRCYERPSGPGDTPATASCHVMCRRGHLSSRGQRLRDAFLPTTCVLTFRTHLF